jgi:hypothetical protein
MNESPQLKHSPTAMPSGCFLFFWTAICLAPAIVLATLAAFDHAGAGPAGMWFPSPVEMVGFVVPLVTAAILTITNAVFFFRSYRSLRVFWFANGVFTLIPVIIVICA